METQIFRLIGISDLIQVPSQRAEGGFILKRSIHLQELAFQIIL